MIKFSLEQANELANELGVNFGTAGFTPEEFLEGLHIELEHGLVDPHTNVTDDDPQVTAKIVLAHLNENPMYYDENIGLEAWEHALDKLKGCDTKGKTIQIV